MELFWENADWEAKDPHLSKVDSMPFYRPFPEMDIKKGIYLIRGPRQVGKSTWLKTLLSKYLKANKKCFYLSCEAVEDYRELSILLKSLRHYEIIFLDEVTFVKEWARAVKIEIEKHEAPSYVITGSNTMDLRAGGERLPGRYGDGGDFELLPMNFSEFEEMRKQTIWPMPSRQDLVLNYFQVGGFPLSMQESGEKFQNPLRSKDTYWKWLVGDISRAGKSEVILKDLLGQLALTQGSQISLQSLARKTQIGSHHTVSEYIQILEDCFALRTLYAIDPNTGAHKHRSERKYYFRDPLIYWIALEKSNQKVPENYLSSIAEAVAAEELCNRYDGIGFYKSRKGEVDFYKCKSWAIEIKWKEVATDISKAFLEVPTPEKTVWTMENFLLEYPKLT